jgi:tetratricopeptide (TPR) repeat protein
MFQRFCFERSSRQPGCATIGRLSRWLAAVFSLWATGCHSLSWQGPVPKSVATCRQFSQQGINAMERGDWDRAESLLSQAVQACPVDSEARRNYAETLWHRGAVNEAAAQLEEARRVAADDTSLAVRTGELYLSMGQVDRALKLADQTLDLDPKAAEAWVLRGRAQESTGHIREALADYQRSLGYCPGNPDVLLRVAEAYRQLHQPERALTVLQNLGDSFPAGEEPQNLLHLQGLALMALGRPNDAVESLTLAAGRGKPTAGILCHLAEAQLLSGHQAEASAAVAQALLLEPDDLESRGLKDRIETAQLGRSSTVLR